MLARYRRINDKGVLGRPWTIWKILRAISSTLKCQFTGNHDFLKRFDYLVRQNIGDPGSIKLRTIFPLTSVVPKPPQLPYGATKIGCWTTGSVFPVFSDSLLGSANQ